LWNEWHLNDMQPNCIHQDSFNCNVLDLFNRNVLDFDSRAMKETLKCPVKYAYGSSWLVKEVPQAIIDRLTELFSKGDAK